MQISPTISVQPVTPVDRTVTSTQTQAQANQATTKVSAVDQVSNQPKVFTPAPPLRPNVQDYVDIDRVLTNLRT